MPLSSVCVSVISNRPRRTWSSSSNIFNKDVQSIFNMNSAEDITTYKDPPFNSPSLQRRTLGCSYDFPEKSYKKDKKWSISNIFRRKKKEDSESSSEEELHKKSFLGRRKKKSESKRKKAVKPAPFDHVVVHPGSRNSLSYNGYNYHEESAIMSDPTAGFFKYNDTDLPQIPSENLEKNRLGDSVDSVRKSKRGLTKARAEARRTSSKNGTSSEEESHVSTSSILIHSEENINKLNKKSRAARTERYLKRHSRDGENPHNYLRISKSDAENWKYSDDSNRSLSRSPLIPRTETKHKLSYSSLNSQSSNVSGLSTVSPSQSNQNKYRVSNSTSNPNYKPPQSMNDYNNSIKKPSMNFNTNNRSVSCDDNIHKAEVLHINFPIMRPKRGFRNLSLIDTSQIPNMKHPPPPPPRDPNRTIGHNYFENNRPNTFYFDNSGQAKSKSLNYTNSYQEQIKKKLYPNYRSTSEDHLARNILSVPLQTRPSSTTPESNKSYRYIIKNEDNQTNTKPIKEEYNYLTDKKPRSRKPIFIKPGNTAKEKDGNHKALNFWKQIDRQTTLNQSIPNKNRSQSPQMFSSHTHVQTKIFLPSVIQSDTKQKEVITSPAPLLDTVTKEDIKRKSSNLEEALNELEAIYNSLKLGDEDLLERAEQKEKEALAKKHASMNVYPCKGTLSDSSFSYEPFDTVDSPRRKRMSKKSHNLKLDDMAFRKINKDRANTIADPQSFVSQVSYLMRSPVFSKNNNSNDHPNDEPDVTLDDVVYRNVKHTNNLLKVIEPQPPFGIPLGPITPGANSDYLHAKPEQIYKPTFKHKKIPDIVKDDLAFRNLRKDFNKGPSLPSNEDFSNNNSEANLRYLKKKRAQRSMSANISNIMGNTKDKEDNFKTLTDIADAMEIARSVLKEKENKISATKKAFMSDTDATYLHSVDSSRESRINFLNELRGNTRNIHSPRLGDNLFSKPPRGLTPERRRSPKESTPIPVSPLEEKRSSESASSSLDDLLKALAEEAKETTERITRELKKLGEEKDDTVSKRLSEIDAVSQKAKLCDKLLQNVVDSKEFIDTLKNTDEEEEEVRSIKEAPIVEESATIVMSRFNNDESSKSNDSEHDYENLTSDNEVNLEISEEKKVVKCLSPFEEHKAELIASFQELNATTATIDVPKESVDGNAVADNHSIRRPRLSRWLRFRSLGNLEYYHLDMSNSQESRSDRIARYKEERRKQLAEQFSSLQASPKTTRTTRTNTNSLIKDGTSSSNAESPRPTRTSKLRAAVLSQENLSAPNNIKEKSPTFDGTESEVKSIANKRIERDKSNKRKSNLNRALNSEEVPSNDFSNVVDIKDRRRRRRFFPSEILESPQSDKERTDTNTTASLTSPTATPITAVTPSKLTHKKSELSMHMENARRSVTSSSPDVGKYKPYAKRVLTSSPKSSTKLVEKVQSNDSLNRLPGSPINQRMIASDDEKTKAIASRMDGLSALTKQTLARVERLTSKTRESPKKIINSKKPSLCSILKKNSVDETPYIVIDYSSSITVGPVSILKRKVSQDSNKLEHSSNNTPPVTFSPSVLEPTTTRRKQGILKKRRSLDESTVLRHRSCSPDVANKTDSRSILKSQRRSSLEELRRTQSPETHLQSILKRRTSKYDDDDHSLNSPQSILKRKSGASSASSTGSSPHVSITTAVILAAAGGAEMVLDSDGESVRPILKKKSFSEEYTHHSDPSSDVPKPILKKKSSTDTDDSEEKPRPILKLPRNSLELDTLEFNVDSKNSKHGSSSETECEFKPILKTTGTREEPTRRLSFRAGISETTSVRNETRQRTSRRSHTICSDFNIDSFKIETREEDSMINKPRPFSVYDLVMSFEQSNSTGAIPKRTHSKRHSDRHKTQPVTINELEASRNLVKSPPHYNDDDSSNPSNFSRSCDSHSLLDFTSSLEKDDSNINSFFSSSMHNQDSPESIACGKMSSDSAFQSLGDGLELEQAEDQLQDTEREQVNSSPTDELSKEQLQIRVVTEEVKNVKLSKGNAGIDRYRSRRSGSNSQFLTQPVTFEEIKAASKIAGTAQDELGDDVSELDPCKMSFEARLKMFHHKINQTENVKPNLVKRSRHCRTRFATDLVSSRDVQSARSFFRKPYRALDGDNCDKLDEKGNTFKSHILPKSALKKQDQKSVGTSPDKDDEGISCNGSGSSSDSDISSTNAKEELKNNEWKVEKKQRKFGGESTSEGESSGGREIKSIFKNDKRLKIKQTLEGVLLKSRSQESLGNESNLAQKTVCQNQNDMPQAIADLRAKLQERGESEWKKRISLHNNVSDELKMLKEKNKYNDEISEKSLLSAKKDELDAASRHWKSRVEKSDAEKFSIAGKMNNKIKDSVPALNMPAEKKIPQPKRFKLKEGTDSTPTSPEKNNNFDLIRSKSMSYSSSFHYSSTRSEEISKITKKSVPVLNPDDITLKQFFKKFEQIDNKDEIEFSLEDFDAIQRQSLLVIKKNVQVQKRRKASKNPIKALACRTDLSNEYTEITTGVAEREKKRLNIEKLAKNSNKALEALAGLASNEDFKSVALKKSSGPIGQVPWKDIMLLQVKGRRHVQTRLVEPKANSINEGDNYILITPKALYTYSGAYCNVIEHSRTSDIVNHIKKSGDLGCKIDSVFSVSANDKISKHACEFWKILGADEIPKTVEAGHPDEDETYESNILLTNMIYTLEKDELIPCDKYWSSIPKVEMLKDTNIFVFDFGSEMYVWSGKNAPLVKKRLALKLAKEMWDEGYNYSDCNICPLNVASMLGARLQEKLPLQEDIRPKWALFAKLTQHRETILFKEKFLDWPDFSRIIRIKSDESLSRSSVSFEIQPCDVEEMLKEKDKKPDLVVEQIHMGRGDQYFDEETKRLFVYETLNVTGWKIMEYSYEELQQKSLGQFYDADSYIFRWDFRQTVRGRELSGNPSKHAAVGRDRCIFFCWQGNNSSINEKGAAALLTVELDKENAPQVRIVQGAEPAAFLQLFNGNMVVNRGKRDNHDNKPRLFLLRGERENEMYLMEVPLSMSSLRSRSSFVLLDSNSEQIIIWHGIKSKNVKRSGAKTVVDNLLKNQPSELHLDRFNDLNVVEVVEGSETEDFLNILGNDKESYYTLLDSKEPFDHTMRLFRMCSLTGEFLATEILCPHRSDHCSPYPFVQSDIYSASQPALFLIDNHYELWLWQGFWPEKKAEDDLTFDQIGTGAVRWQAERKTAMQTALEYWRKKHNDIPLVAYLVSAGLEPIAFKNLFPTWEDRLDVMEMGKKVGKTEGEMLSLEEELTLLSRTTYPLSELLQRPLPEGVDPTNIEKYLSPEDFQKLLSMSKEEFEKLPPWRKAALKKEKGLF